MYLNENFHLVILTILVVLVSTKDKEEAKYTGWKEKFVRGCHRILHLRFDGNIRKASAAKLILILNFKLKKFFFLALYSTRHKEP